MKAAEAASDWDRAVSTDEHACCERRDGSSGTMLSTNVRLSQEVGVHHSVA